MLKGRVLDEKEVPIAGVTVMITYLPWNKTITAETNKKGIYFVAGPAVQLSLSRNIQYR